MIRFDDISSASSLFLFCYLFAHTRAAGVILYIMLTGFPPYDQASRTDQRFELIVTGRLMEQLRNWDIFLTEDAGDLMQKMLQLDPRDRLTLAEVMQHPWITNTHVEPPTQTTRLMF